MGISILGVFVQRERGDVPPETRRNQDGFFREANVLAPRRVGLPPEAIIFGAPCDDLYSEKVSELLAPTSRSLIQERTEQERDQLAAVHPLAFGIVLRCVL